MFLSASDVRSVFTLIAVDVIENMALALRVISLVQAGRNEAAQRGVRRNAAEMLDLRERTDRLVRNEGKLVRRIKRLEGRSGCEGEDVELEAIGASAEQEAEEVDNSLSEGEENVHLQRAVRLLLKFLASECAEMISSAWSMVMLPFLYYSPNKKWFYTLEDYDDEDYHRALYYSSVDFVLEMVTFAAMLVFFALHAKINVYGVGIGYFRRKKLFVMTLLMGMVITQMAFGFFSKEQGCDPTFKFDFPDFRGNATAAN